MWAGLAVAVCIAIVAPGCTYLMKKPEPVDLLDHFLCHTIDGEEFKDPPQVILKDQFPQELEDKPIQVGQRAYLCNPVEKVHDGHTYERKDKKAHLVCYLLSGGPYNRKVQVANQLQPNGAMVTTEEVSLLCLPSGKSETRDPDPVPEKLDHFKCYTATATPDANVAVNLTEQFFPNGIDVTALRLRYLCNPVEKKQVIGKHKPKPKPSPKPFHDPTVVANAKGGPDEPNVLHKDAHLACYSMVPVGDPTLHVTISNQFEDAALEPVLAEMLCVPSTKKELATTLTP